MNRLFFIPISFLFFSCTNNDIKKPNSDELYFHYRIWGDEESGIVTVKLQYLAGGRNGQAIELEKPARVELDGKTLEAGASKFEGSYYELICDVNGFAGNHTIVFSDKDGNKYKEDFEFPVIHLVSELAATIKRDSIILEFDGILPGDVISVLLTDTSFYGRGMERTDTVKNGRIMITKDELKWLKSGPVYLEVIREEMRRLEQTMLKGGIISISYGLKREFILED